MGHTLPITRVLTQTTWTGREVAQLVLSAAEDLSGGREPVFTEAEAARLRRGLPPDAWRDYVWWVEGWGSSSRITCCQGRRSRCWKPPGGYWPPRCR